MSPYPMDYFGAPLQVAEEQKRQAATNYPNLQYYPPAPSHAPPFTPQYDTPPVPPAYDNAGYKSQYEPHDSYFAEKPSFQQSQQPHWPVPYVNHQHIPYQPPSQRSEYPPPPQYPYSPQSTLSPPSQYPPPPKSPQPDLSTPPWTTSYAPPSPFSPPPQFAQSPRFPPTPAITPMEFAPPQSVDDPKSNGVKRFVGNMLVSRVVRASVQSVTSSVTLPMYLSPWGDNNPVTLPNVRKRDAALAGGAILGAAGLETLAPSIFEITGTAVDSVIVFAGKQVAEQVADEGIDKIKHKKPVKVVMTANIKSLEIRIKHKLMGKDADIRLIGEYPVRHQFAYDKGWFCPYLYASGRTPAIPRAHDFAIATLSSPSLRGRLHDTSYCNQHTYTSVCSRC